jgi:hypothetical protein
LGRRSDNKSGTEAAAFRRYNATIELNHLRLGLAGGKRWRTLDINGLSRCATLCVCVRSDKIDRRRAADVEQVRYVVRANVEAKRAGGRPKMAVLSGHPAECTTSGPSGSRRVSPTGRSDQEANERYALKCVKGVSGVAVPPG